MGRKPRKPRPISVHPVRLYATRGPHKDGSGRWYWKAILSRDGKQRAVWTGWARSDDAAQAVADLVATGRLESPEESEEISTLKHLLEYWLGMQTERRDIAPSTLRGYTYSARRLAQVLVSAVPGPARCVGGCRWGARP